MERRSYSLADGELSALHFGDVSEPVRLVFLHANGFNAQSYRVVMEALGVHAIVFDMRGHGESRNLPQPPNLPNWHIFAEDCVTFFDRHLSDLTDDQVVLGGHSFGAVSAVLAAPKVKTRLNGYVGFDPVSLPFLARLYFALPGGRASMKKRFPLARNAGRRKAVFETPEAAFTRWQDRSAFRGMSDEILRDYIESGLTERGDGQWELACDPKWEQAIYVSQWHNLYKAAKHLPENATFIYAGGHLPVSSPRTRSAVRRARTGMNVEFRAELDHLFPFTTPDAASQVLKTVLTKAVN